MKPDRRLERDEEVGLLQALDVDLTHRRLAVYAELDRKDLPPVRRSALLRTERELRASRLALTTALLHGMLADSFTLDLGVANATDPQN